MDIRLKNNKRFTILLSAGILLLVSVVLYLLYPFLHDRAELFLADEMKNETLIEALYRQNYVLYQDYREFIDQKESSFGELYFSVEKQQIDTTKTDTEDGEIPEDTEINEFSEDSLNYFDDYIYSEDDIRNISSERRNAVDSLVNEWKNEELILTGLDYCVLESSSGYLNKNTNISLEQAVAGTEEQFQALYEQYLFYILFTYDASGRLSALKTGGMNADELLKLAKSMERQELLEWNESYRMKRNDGSLYSVTMKTRKPKDITIIYGVTQEQWNAMVNPSRGDVYAVWNQISAYNNAGVRGILSIILIGLAVIALLLPKLPRYQLHKFSFLRKVPLEAVVIVGAFCLFTGIDGIIYIMIRTNNGYFLELFGGSRYLGVINVTKLFIAGLNIILLFLFFVVWYGTVTVLYPLEKQGLRAYLSERCMSRSIVTRGVRGLKHFWKELVSYDLSQKMEWMLLRLILLNLVVVYGMAAFLGGFGLILYTAGLLYFLRKWLSSVKIQYDKLLTSSKQLADGDLNTPITTDTGMFQAVSKELTQIQEGLKNAVEEELKSQRMKTELITNVSHDLKTPLTAIITFIDLLKQKGLTQEEQEGYLKTLEQKSQRLKVLIEDLFEISKATSNNVTLNLMDVDIISLMKQVWYELSDRIEQSGLKFRLDLPEEKYILSLDSQKTYRIFENLYVNILKYAMAGTRVYISAKYTEGNLKIELKNISAAELTVNPNELAERFVRGDSSRNTEGSGLGLAIAKSFTELQGGRMEIETDGDLFKVTLWWPLLLQLEQETEELLWEEPRKLSRKRD